MTDTTDETQGEGQHGGHLPAGISPVAIEDELKRSYLDYAMSVIVSRALPDARDGLKPVHRRILYMMDVSGFTPEKSYVKCARPVGDTMGRLHPHGDSAIYMALVRMAQPFSMGLQLIDGQGNFGSVDGDMPAAMRYTECRLAKAAMPMLADIKRELTSALGILDKAEGVAQRATFIVDPQGIIRFVYVTDLSVGRNPEEVLRILDGLQTDELCPCNRAVGGATL